MEIYFTSEVDFSEWDRLASRSLFHSRKWIDILSDSYGVAPFYAMAKNGGEYSLIAACKVGSKYISLPYTHITGFLSNSEDAKDALQSALVESNRLIRYRGIGECLPSSIIVNSVVELTDIKSYWMSLSSNMRNQIRKSRQQGELEFCENASVSDFYSVLAKNMHALGTPVHSFEFYKNLRERLDACRIFSVRLNGVTVAAMCGIYANDLLTHKEPTFFNLWASTLRDYDKFYVNYFLYWNMFESVAAQGVRYVDLGTSIKGSGVFNFKQKLNAVNYSVNQYIVGSESPQKSYKESKAAAVFSKLWTGLPYPLTLRLGPMVRKYLV